MVYQRLVESKARFKLDFPDQKLGSWNKICGGSTPQKTNMTMEHQPFEDVSPIKKCDFPACHVIFRVGTS